MCITVTMMQCIAQYQCAYCDPSANSTIVEMEGACW